MINDKDTKHHIVQKLMQTIQMFKCFLRLHLPKMNLICFD